MKVIHLPTATGGNSWGLSRGERELGLESDVMYAYNSWLGYPCDYQFPISDSRITNISKLIPLFLEYRKKYDVFHYNFGRTLFYGYSKSINNLELPLLKNKKIFVTFNGCDARQKLKRIKQADITMCKCDDCYEGACNGKTDHIKEKNINRFKRSNVGFFALNPDIMYFLPDNTTFLPYTIASWSQIEKATTNVGARKPVRIIHAPTDRVFKGTDAVIRAVDNIQRKYPGRVELVLIENMSHANALKEYAKADILVEQLRAGWYGALAVELMKMGKPVIAYINRDDLHFLPPKMAKECEEAIINANEYNLESRLLYYIENQDKLQEKQKAQYEYIHMWHDPKYVASITKEKYEEN